jgi:TRAP transporter TAXI family solute receptor
VGKNPIDLLRKIRRLSGVLGFASACLFPITGQAQQGAGDQEYGIAKNRPVLQASCQHCPWGALGDILKKIMAPQYDIAICYSCSGRNGVRFVSKRLVSAEINDRQFAQGVTFRPDAPIDFGITQLEFVQWAYQGTNGYEKDGPFKNLRMIARIEGPSYLMIAAVKSSGITDLRKLRENKTPVRIMTSVRSEVLDSVLDYYGLTRKNVAEWGGKFLEGTLLLKNPDFDLIIGVGTLSNYPEGNMWYEMTQKKDLEFFPVPEDLRQKLVKDYDAELVDLPVRYMRGVGDAPLPSVGISGLAVYGRDDLPEQFVLDIAKGLDDKRGQIKWASQPFSYDSSTVWNGRGVPLHPAAERYYRERGYMK